MEIGTSLNMNNGVRESSEKKGLKNREMNIIH